LTKQSSNDVGRAARGGSDYQVYRPRRVRLRPCDTRNDRERSGARGEMQKSAAGKYYGALLAKGAAVSAAAPAARCRKVRRFTRSPTAQTFR